MKNIVFSIAITAILAACGTSKKTTAPKQPVAEPANTNVTVGKATKVTTTGPVKDMPVVTPKDVVNPKEIIQVPPPITEAPASQIIEEIPKEIVPDLPTPIEKAVFDHASFNELLKNNVSAAGNVDYKKFHLDRTVLRMYIFALGKKMPTNAWSKEDKLAYWMNAYNAMTIDLILRNQPIASIKDIKDPWKQRLWKLGDKWYNLDEIEHKILRKMDDPRIHFGINCASFSCPPLLNEAFTSKNVDTQLDALARQFVNDTSRNTITPDRVTVSKIFNWFSKDFKQEGSLIDYLNKYAETPINSNAKVRYMDYNWELNE